MARSGTSRGFARRRTVLLDALEARRLMSGGVPSWLPAAPAPVPVSDFSAAISTPVSASHKSEPVRSDIPLTVGDVPTTAAAVGPAGAHATPTAVLLGPAAVPSAAGEGAIPAGGGAPATSPFSPQEIAQFYGINGISFNGITGNGAGQTIAIIDAYDTPNLVSSSSPTFDTSDLHVFDQQYGIADPPSFVKVSESGTGAVPTATDTSWGLEACLDVEWAHALAPMANIVLFEANSSSLYDLLANAAVSAGEYAGVSVVSMSFVESESSGDAGYDGDFTAPGVTYLAATGDQGSTSTGYPSLSPNVVAVGGTSITTTDAAGDYGSETVWNNTHGATGGGPSAYEARPAYQSGLTIAGTTRATPDVSFDGDPLTGASVYDSAYGTSTTGWYRVGGTSLSTPCWAALIAIADQGRSTLGLSPLAGSTGTLPRLYQLPSTDFNDITTGSNIYSQNTGYDAAAGYDMASGIGTPVANLLVPDLAGGATVTGRVYIDNNGDDQFDAGDTVLSAQKVYLDLNNSGVYNANDPVAYTNASGVYTFTDQIGHETGTVRMFSPLSGYLAENNSPALATAFGSTQTVDFGLYRTVQATSGNGDTYTLTLDPTGTRSQIFYEGQLVDSAPFSLATTLTFDFQGVDDSLTVNAANGNPVPTGGLTVTGTPSASDTLTIVGSAGNDSYNVAAGSVVFSGRTITESNVSGLTLNPGAGLNSISVVSGSATISAVNAGSGFLTRNFSSISIGSTGSLAVATAAAHSDRTLVLTGGLTVATGGRFDLGGNDMVLSGGGAAGLSALSTLASTGDHMGNWNGPGLCSSAAAADSSHLTALGIAPATVFGAAKSFDGYTPAPADVLVKYTWYGDTNLDGKVDGSDYSKIDFAASVAGYTGWANGDFNYDSAVDGTDYALIDNASNNQSGTL